MMTKGRKLVALLAACALLCVGGGLLAKENTHAVYADAPSIVAEGTESWIAATNAFDLYTLDSGGNRGTFAFNQASNANGKSVVVDFGTDSEGQPTAEQKYVFTKIQFPSINADTTKVVVEVSLDGETYKTAVESTDLAGENKVLEFPQAVEARFVKVTLSGNWCTLWGTQHPFLLYGYAGELTGDTDPAGIELIGVDPDYVYTFVKGDSLQLASRFINPLGVGDVSYTVTDGQEIVSVSGDGLLTVAELGDGTTQYEVTASVPNKEGTDVYQTKMKFVVLAEEHAKIFTYYNADKGAYDMLDIVGVRLVRAFGEGAGAQYSMDGQTWTDMAVNAYLPPVGARYLKVTGNNVAIYGEEGYTARTVSAVTSESINGFYPDKPLENVVDGDLLTFAQTPNTNLLGSEVKGSVILELAACTEISAVRVYAFWASLGNCYLSYSVDGVTFTGNTPVHLGYVAQPLGDDAAEFMAIVSPENVNAKYVRLNITSTVTSLSFMAIRELTVYGKDSAPVDIAWSANTEVSGVTGIPAGESVALGTLLTKPADPVLEGYVFGGWFTDEGCTREFDFTKPVASALTLYAKWREYVAPETYAVLLEQTGQGSVEGIPTVAVEEGTVLTLTFTAAEGYELKSVTVNGGEVEIENGSYTFTVGANTTIAVRFEQKELPPVLEDENVVGIQSVSCNLGCYDGEGPDKLYDRLDTTYMNPTGSIFTLVVELDGVYQLSAFRWLAFQGYYPNGSIYTSVDGGSLTLLTHFDFEDGYVEDPLLGANFVMEKSVDVTCKYLYITVNSGPNGVVATREFTLYGEKITPTEVDPQGITIADKDAEGEYNTAATAYKAGDSFRLSATQTNAASMQRVTWRSLSPYMLSVDGFGNVTVLRGGSKPYYEVEASVTSPDGVVYKDSVKIYVEAVTNVAQVARLSWSGADGWHSAPTEGFDGVVSQWGNWIQPADGTDTYELTCDFAQSVRFGRISIYIGVNAPKGLEIFGIDGEGVRHSVKKYTTLTANTVLTETGDWEYTGFVFVVEDKGAVSTIHEIELYNHPSFALDTLKNSFDVSEERGPGTQGVYIPSINQGNGTSGNGYKGEEPETGEKIFTYRESKTDVILYVVFGVTLAGALAIGGLLLAGKIKNRRS